MKYLILFLGLCHALGLEAKTPPKLDKIQSELAVVQDVFRSAVQKSIDQKLRLSNVKAHFLARQGVMITFDVASPWISMNRLVNGSTQSVHINADLEKLSEIPELVHDILADLKIGVSPYDPEELEALRELRQEQREIRGEQRTIRAKLREQRREFVSQHEEEKRQKAARKIAELERELEGTAVEYTALNQDIDTHFQQMRETRTAYSQTATTQSEKVALDRAIAKAVCQFGTTMRSLRNDQYLSIAIRKPDSLRYFVFSMEQVRNCSRGDIKADKLLANAYDYQG